MSNKEIFRGMEQGKGKNRNTIYLLMTPKMRGPCQEWLEQNIRLTFVLKSNNNYICSVKPQSKSLTSYNDKLNKFIAKSMTTQELQYNDFRNKHASFVAALSKENKNVNKAEIQQTQGY